MHKQLRNIDELSLWDKNPRGIKEEDYERLKKQIKRLGQYKPLIINKDGVVLGGNMRLRVYRDMGVKEVWVSEVDAKTEEKMIEYALSDNDRAGYYEEEMLAELIMTYPDVNYDQFKVDLGKLTDIGTLLEKFAGSGEDEGIDYNQEFQVVIECKDETEQEEIYNKAQELGWTVKVLTL